MSSRIYKVNELYFENINTQKKAYFLGLLYADGNNCKSGNRRVSLVLQEKDLYILEELKKEIEYEGPISNIKNKYRGLVINSAKISRDLEKLGVVPRKTFLLDSLPNISCDLIHHFLRGYFDGDGYVGIANRGRLKLPSLRINIIGNNAFVQEVQKILIKDGKMSETKLQKYKNPLIKAVEYSGNRECKKFYNYIYKNSSIHMNRKKEKFEIIQ